MTNINATNFRKNMFEYLNMAIDFNDVVNISTKKGNAIVMSEEDYRSLMETLHILSAPGMDKRLEEAQKATLKDCEDFEW